MNRLLHSAILSNLTHISVETDEGHIRMNSFALQRRLDAISRDLGGIQAVIDRVLSRLEALGTAAPPSLDLPPTALADGIIETRRARDALFGSGYFADPAWDMLLHLYVADEAGAPLSVSALCAAAALPQTTAQRWVESLAAARLIVRRADQADARRTLISLSPEAHHAMTAVLARLKAALFPPPGAGGPAASSSG